MEDSEGHENSQQKCKMTNKVYRDGCTTRRKESFPDNIGLYISIKLTDYNKFMMYFTMYMKLMRGVIATGDYYYLLPIVKWKPHEPDLTLLVVKLVNDGDIGVIMFQFCLVEETRLPAHYSVLTTLAKYNLRIRKD